METDERHLKLRLAETDADRRAAERLRYDVFVRELGGDGPLVDHEGGFERDQFDAVCDHMILVDDRRDPDEQNHVVGVYRLLRSAGAREIGAFYCESEYDLTVLKDSGRNLLELGRSCVNREYRGGHALHLLWQGLAGYVQDHQIDILFGVASFHGTDINKLAMPLSHLYHSYLAPPELRVRAIEATYQTMELIPADQVDRLAAMRAIPPLIKGYLRLGGCVGDGAFVDHAFNTTDVCLVVDTARLSASARARYAPSGR
jgi:L-ornithine Nalpha-acyltransferase